MHKCTNEIMKSTPIIDLSSLLFHNNSKAKTNKHSQDIAWVTLGYGPVFLFIICFDTAQGHCLSL